MRQAGFTLMELILAVAITAVVGLAAATMASVLSSAHLTNESTRDAVGSARSALMHIAGAVRRGQVVTAVSPSELAIWTGDANDDTLINPDELVYFQYVAADGTVRSSRLSFDAASPHFRELLNAGAALTAVDSLAEVRTCFSSAAVSAYRTDTTLASGVKSFRFATKGAALDSSLVTMQIGVGDGPSAVTVTGAARLRVPQKVEYVAGQPVLRLEQPIAVSDVLGGANAGH